VYDALEQAVRKSVGEVYRDDSDTTTQK
jgi:hypothetical protein